MRKFFQVVTMASALTFGLAGVGSAQVKDAWVTAKTKIVLLTTDGLRTSALNVDTVNGVVTLHGKVPTKDESERAERVAMAIDGVKAVKNLLQVVPLAKQDEVDADDAAIKGRVESAFKDSPALSKSDIHISSVNKGVVLLSGSADDVLTHLRAIEVAYMVKGVRRVSSEVTVKKDS